MAKEDSNATANKIDIGHFIKYNKIARTLCRSGAKKWIKRYKEFLEISREKAGSVSKANMEEMYADFDWTVSARTFLTEELNKEYQQRSNEFIEQYKEQTKDLETNKDKAPFKDQLKYNLGMLFVELYNRDENYNAQTVAEDISIEEVDDIYNEIDEGSELDWAVRNIKDK